MNLTRIKHDKIHPKIPAHYMTTKNKIVQF
jgi:hypothetical protein